MAFWMKLGLREIMDEFVMKLRMARHPRTPEYNKLFGGDPMWITEAVGGIGEDGRHGHKNSLPDTEHSPII